MIVSGQGWLFIATAAVGMGIGLFYDIFRVMRKVASHPTWVVQLQDVLFWGAATIATFYFLLVNNFGEIRFFSLLGVAIGLVLYFMTISKAVVKTAVVIVTFVKRVLTVVLRIVLLPLRLVCKLVEPIVKKVGGKLTKALHIGARCGKMQVKKITRNWFILRKKV